MLDDSKNYMFNDDFINSVANIEPEASINSTVSHIVQMEQSVHSSMHQDYKQKSSQMKKEDNSLHSMIKDISEHSRLTDNKFMDLIDQINLEESDLNISPVAPKAVPKPNVLIELSPDNENLDNSELTEPAKRSRP